MSGLSRAPGAMARPVGSGELAPRTPLGPAEEHLAHLHHHVAGHKASDRGGQGAGSHGRGSGGYGPGTAH
jgi:hypothetical protein